MASVATLTAMVAGFAYQVLGVGIVEGALLGLVVAALIGVLTGVQGMRWYEVTVRGQESHTGATPMGLRRNALLGAARMIDAIHLVGMDHLPGVASVGLIENRPNSRNVVPGEVFFTVDLRHPDEAVLDRMEQAYQAALPKIAGELKLDEGAVAFGTGDALHIPAGVWHAVVNTGEEDVEYLAVGISTGQGGKTVVVA